VFTNDSNYIRYLTWSQESRSWTKNNIAYNNDGLSFNLVGCVPPSMQRQIFAVGGPNRPIKIFKKTEKYHKLSNPMKHWKELCSWSEPINIMAMSLSANGRSLAVLSEEGVVRVFSIWFPVLRTGTARLTFEPLIDEVPRITLGTTVEQEVEFKFMAWSRDNFLLISGDTLATVTILEFVEYKNEMHVVHDDTDGLGNGVDCIPPYNLVTQLCVCPHRQEMLSVLGHKGLILFWENVHYFARCKRDILKEKFPDDVPEMVDKLDLLQKEFDQQWANLNSKLVDATSQFKSMEERYMAIRERVEYYMRRVYEGKTDDLEKVLLDIYLKGKFRSML
jgi:WD40 repeat protein